MQDGSEDDGSEEDPNDALAQVGLIYGKLYSTTFTTSDSPGRELIISSAEAQPPVD